MQVLHFEGFSLAEERAQLCRWDSYGGERSSLDRTPVGRGSRWSPHHLSPSLQGESETL